VNQTGRVAAFGAGEARFERMSRDESIVGKLGIVTHAIQAGKPGEIVVHIRGGTETYMAYSDTDVPEQAEVVVVSKRSARTVEVTPFIT
jgi:membrane protein implicated in regulation of membrane protease activity